MRGRAFTTGMTGTPPFPPGVVGPTPIKHESVEQSTPDDESPNEETGTNDADDGGAVELTGDKSLNVGAGTNDAEAGIGTDTTEMEKAGWSGT